MLRTTFKSPINYIISINPTQVGRGFAYLSRQWSLPRQLASWFGVPSFSPNEVQIPFYHQEGGECRNSSNPLRIVSWSSMTKNNFKLSFKYICVNCCIVFQEEQSTTFTYKQKLKLQQMFPFLKRFLNSLTDLWLNWWINLFGPDFINPLIILPFTHIDLIFEIYSMWFKRFNLYYFNQLTFTSGLDDGRPLKDIVN